VSYSFLRYAMHKTSIFEEVVIALRVCVVHMLILQLNTQRCYYFCDNSSCMNYMHIFSEQFIKYYTSACIECNKNITFLSLLA
jgi:hypothetical protein